MSHSSIRPLTVTYAALAMFGVTQCAHGQG